MQSSKFRKALFVMALGAIAADSAQAFNFGNMMNPTRWWGGDRDRYDDNYYGAPPYGYGYPAPGYAVPGYAPPGYAAPGYTAPGYGYAAPAPAPAPAKPAATPAPAAPAPAASAAAPAATDDNAEIARLKRRLSELERAGPATTPAPHPYDQDYRFPDSAQGAAGSSASVSHPAVPSAAQQYPVYSPFGPPAEFPPLAPDSESATPVDVSTVVPPVPALEPVRPVGAAPAPAAPSAPDGGVVNFSPYGNPATYQPPMQDTGQKVFEFGR